MPSLRIKRGTRAQIDAAATSSGLNAGEPYLITDEGLLAVGLTASTYATYLRTTDARIDGYQETGVATLASVAGTLTVPLDGRPRVATLTENVTLAVGSAPTAPLTGSCHLTLIQAAGNYTVTLPSGWWGAAGADHAMPTGAGARKEYLLYTKADGSVGIKVESLEQTT